MSFEVRPLVLVGAGHAHVVTLRKWLRAGYRPPQGSVLVSNDRYAWYSGMMPGLLAGRYRIDQCRIDLTELCQRCGVELLLDEACELRADDRLLRLTSGDRLRAGCLSLNVGSTPPLPDLTGANIEALPAKPFSLLVGAWQRWRDGHAPASITVAGGGAAAFELAMCLDASLPETRLRLITGAGLLDSYHDRVRVRARRLLDAAGIELTERQQVAHVRGNQIRSPHASLGVADALVVATGAGAYAWPCESGLLCDRGFVRVDATLRSVSHPSIFAAGDCAALPHTPHAGVYAVRQGEHLAHNLQATLAGGSMKLYHPQPRALALLSTGDGRALLSYGPLTGHNRFLGRWKDHLDRSFIGRPGR